MPGIYEPALVLAAGPSPLDSFLTLSNVEELKVNSEMTVLSACNTGSGKYYTGEGVMGLGRGFLLAGSRSVLVSLWPISSDTTVEFMTIYYKYLLSKRTKSESLRLTQLQFLHRKGIRTSVERGILLKAKDKVFEDVTHPFYWAPFVLIGE
jgi:CHAT domain-containing protein